MPDIIAGLLLVALASAMTYYTYRKWQDWDLLRRSGVEIEGRVLQLWTTRGGSGIERFRYYVTFEFTGETADGGNVNFSGNTRIDMITYEHLQNGNPAIVRYVRSNPNLHHLKGQDPVPVYPSIASVSTWAAAVIFIMTNLS